jgi:hypothetical protein
MTDFLDRNTERLLWALALMCLAVFLIVLVVDGEASWFGLGAFLLAVLAWKPWGGDEK